MQRLAIPLHSRQKRTTRSYQRVVLALSVLFGLIFLFILAQTIIHRSHLYSSVPKEAIGIQIFTKSALKQAANSQISSISLLEDTPLTLSTLLPSVKDELIYVPQSSQGQLVLFKGVIDENLHAIIENEGYIVQSDGRKTLIHASEFDIELAPSVRFQPRFGLKKTNIRLFQKGVFVKNGQITSDRIKIWDKAMGKPIQEYLPSNNTIVFASFEEEVDYINSAAELNIFTNLSEFSYLHEDEYWQIQGKTELSLQEFSAIVRDIALTSRPEIGFTLLEDGTPIQELRLNSNIDLNSEEIDGGIQVTANLSDGKLLRASYINGYIDIEIASENAATTDLTGLCYEPNHLTMYVDVSKLRSVTENSIIRSGNLPFSQIISGDNQVHICF